MSKKVSYFAKAAEEDAEKKAQIVRTISTNAESVAVREKSSRVRVSLELDPDLYYRLQNYIISCKCAGDTKHNNANKVIRLAIRDYLDHVSTQEVEQQDAHR